MSYDTTFKKNQKVNDDDTEILSVFPIHKQTIILGPTDSGWFQTKKPVDWTISCKLQLQIERPGETGKSCKSKIIIFYSAGTRGE